MFLCDKEKYDDIKDDNKDLTFVIVMDGNGFEIPMNLLFEQTRENDYEFFVHFKDYEQNIWNLGHPFFHQFTIIFDQDNQEIGVDGKNVYDLKETSIFDNSLIENIDETNYGKEKFTNLKDKIDWVCLNFEKVARRLKDVTRD